MGDNCILSATTLRRTDIVAVNLIEQTRFTGIIVVVTPAVSCERRSEPGE
jgi:hypothetical protein